MERRALYNSLRVNWLADPTLKVKPWQVADYRSYSLEDLFKGLFEFGIVLDRAHFISLADSSDTPEDLAETLLPDEIEEQEEADQVYLLVFELWRRLLPEKQALSLFCDELDFQIELYDNAKAESFEGIEDALANLKALLDENSDDGADPHALFESILQGCAHDVEGFLYNYISTQLDNENSSYARELVEGFFPYVVDAKWFELLNVRVLANSDWDESHHLVQQLIKDAQKEPDVEFQLELLAYLAKKGEERAFLSLVKQTLPLLEQEEDFWDLLSSCEDFFHFKDMEDKEKLIATMLKRRTTNSATQPISNSNQDLMQLQQILWGAK